MVTRYYGNAMYTTPIILLVRTSYYSEATAGLKIKIIF